MQQTTKQKQTKKLLLLHNDVSHEVQRSSLVRACKFCIFPSIHNLACNRFVFPESDLSFAIQQQLFFILRQTPNLLSMAFSSPTCLQPYVDERIFRQPVCISLSYFSQQSIVYSTDQGYTL